MALTLEEENLNMFEFDNSLTPVSSIKHIDKNLVNIQIQGKYKTQAIQFPELESKSTDTVKV